jgi:hypothetical protein
MKLSRIIELEIEGNEEILNFAEKEYKGGIFYISDIPLRKIDSKAKKIVIILSISRKYKNIFS